MTNAHNGNGSNGGGPDDESPSPDRADPRPDDAGNGGDGRASAHGSDRRLAGIASGGGMVDSDGVVRISLGSMPELIGYNLRLAQLRVFEHFRETLKLSGDPVLATITPGLFRILVLVRDNPGLNQSRLAAAVGIDRSTLVPILNKLSKLGLIERRPSRKDGRAHSVHLTFDGASTVGRMEDLVDQHEQEIAKSLTKRERTQLIGLLRKLGDR